MVALRLQHLTHGLVPRIELAFARSYVGVQTATPMQCHDHGAFLYCTGGIYRLRIKLPSLQCSAIRASHTDRFLRPSAKRSTHGNAKQAKVFKTQH